MKVVDNEKLRSGFGGVGTGKTQKATTKSSSMKDVAKVELVFVDASLNYSLRTV